MYQCLSVSHLQNKYINILVFNTHQSHILTFTSTIVSSVGWFVVPPVEFMYLYTLCAAVMTGDGSTFHFASIYSGCSVNTIKSKSSFWRCFQWLSNMFDGGAIKNQIFVKQYSLFCYCQFKKHTIKYFCIKCALDAKQEIRNTTQRIYFVFRWWLCFDSDVLQFSFYLWILKQPGRTKAAQLKSKTL